MHNLYYLYKNSVGVARAIEPHSIQQKYFSLWYNEVMNTAMTSIAL